MPRWATKAIIGTTNFATACKVLVLDGDQFLLTQKGSMTPGAGGTPRVQAVTVGTKGLSVGLSIPFCPAASLTAIAGLFNTALAANPPAAVACEFQDALIHYTGYVFPDFSQKWLTYGPESEGIVSQVVIRLITAT
jgi:hypothetical protein